MWDWEEVHPQSLLGRLRSMPDPRRRQARVYSLAGILAMLILAAAHGESSLRGMWVWAQARWLSLAEGLGFWDVSRPPALTTVWNVLGKLDEAVLAEVLGEAVVQKAETEEEAFSMDSKVLRGSKRRRSSALQVVTAVGQSLKQVLGQARVSNGDAGEAVLAILRTLPLSGKVVSMDAGTLQRPVAATVLEKGGPTWGSSRGITAK